ncbi:flagellar export protein FliJ [Alkalimonas collagenimarina]|uniref:Flagellar FliJ protein n=1 Tax=Alkalimonas collagenimarina TaxID=400390 RepID=A0ABT9H2K6_9GAMM|nr:flagellar export protein FliJ [Alkalimonas collagenimarina]MDP4537541.1 flagellar export protein FliJ [Alkalimonas collagenimarina]
MVSKQLELLARVQKDREEKLEAQFVQAMQFMRQSEQKYQGLADYRTDYIVQSQQQGAAGLESRQYSQFIRFIAKLDQALEQQAQQIHQAQSVVEQRREKWLAMQKKRKAIDYLLERQQLEQDRKAAKAEQVLLDEVATQQFVRRQLLP